MRARGIWQNIKRKDIYLTKCKNIEKDAKQERKEIKCPRNYTHEEQIPVILWAGNGKSRGWFAALEMQNGKTLSRRLQPER